MTILTPTTNANFYPNFTAGNLYNGGILRLFLKTLRIDGGFSVLARPNFSSKLGRAGTERITRGTPVTLTKTNAKPLVTDNTQPTTHNGRAIF